MTRKISFALQQIDIERCVFIDRTAKYGGAHIAALIGKVMMKVNGKARSDSKERIIKAAAELFSQHGYHAVGMSDLQQAVQLGRGSLYHHISSKEDLLFEIVSEYIQELLVGAEQAKQTNNLVTRIEILGTQLVEKIASHQAELTVCFREVRSLSATRYDEVMALHSKYEAIWKNAFKEGAAARVFRAYDPIILKSILGMYYYSYLWIKSDEKKDAADIAKKMNELTLRMLQAQA
jgi:AcrR family transcriptional regulator